MAYNNEIEFPNGIDAPTDAFPNGKPKNATSEAGTDGYPFEELKQSDFEAILQGLLAQNNVSPNNVGDTVLQGQYIDAMFAKFGRQYDLAADMDDNKFIREGDLVQTKDFQAANDGRSRVYRIALTSNVPAPKANDIVLADDSSDFTAVFIAEISSRFEWEELTLQAWFVGSIGGGGVARISAKNGMAVMRGAIECVGSPGNNTLFHVPDSCEPVHQGLGLTITRLRNGSATVLPIAVTGNLVGFMDSNQDVQQDDVFYLGGISYALA